MRFIKFAQSKTSFSHSLSISLDHLDCVLLHHEKENPGDYFPCEKKEGKIKMLILPFNPNVVKLSFKILKKFHENSHTENEQYRNFRKLYFHSHLSDLVRGLILARQTANFAGPRQEKIFDSPA